MCIHIYIYIYIYMYIYIYIYIYRTLTLEEGGPRKQPLGEVKPWFTARSKRRTAVVAERTSPKVGRLDWIFGCSRFGKMFRQMWGRFPWCFEALLEPHARKGEQLGWHYLSKATCLIRPRSLVMRASSCQGYHNCYIRRHFCRKTCVRQVVLDKWFPLSNGEASGRYIIQYNIL